MKTYITNVKYLDKLDELGLSTDEYVIGASAALVVYGYPHVNDDIDLAVRPDVLERLIKEGKVQSRIRRGKQFWETPDGRLDICTEDGGLFQEPFTLDNSQVIEGYRFDTLETSLKFYTTLVPLKVKDAHRERLEWIKSQLQ